MRCTLPFLGLVLLWAGPTLAQAPSVRPSAVATAPVDAATLKVARDVVTKMQGDRNAVLASMSAPMIGLIQQLGVKEPDRAPVLVQEVVLPVLNAHYDELLDVQARAYAATLSVPDLQAVSSFYDTPAGRNLVSAQPRLAQAQLSGMTQWMGSLAPELQGKLAQAIQAHGWGAKTR